MCFQRSSERIEGKSRLLQSGWKIVPQSRTGCRETPVAKFVVCSWHEQLPDVVGMNETSADDDQRQTDDSYQQDTREQHQRAIDARARPSWTRLADELAASAAAVALVWCGHYDKFIRRNVSGDELNCKRNFRNLWFEILECCRLFEEFEIPVNSVITAVIRWISNWCDI